jgi:hypothetical protein
MQNEIEVWIDSFLLRPKELPQPRLLARNNLI